MRNPKLKVSTRKKNKIDSAMTDNVAYGPEPKFGKEVLMMTNDKYREQLGLALDWYNYRSTDTEQKNWFIKYLKETGIPSGNIEKVSDTEFRNAGSIVRITERGLKIKDFDRYIAEHIKRLEDTYRYSKRNELSVKTKPLYNSRVGQAISLFNTVIDNFLEGGKPLGLSAVKILTNTEATLSDKNTISKRFSFMVKEFSDYLAGDEDTVESYGNLNSQKISKLLDFLNGMNLYMPSVEIEKRAQTPRKQRRKKEKSPAQILKKFLCMDFDKQLRISSVKPASFLGSQQLIIYHTDKRKLGVFNAADESGLTVSGSSIRNYDEETSFSKTIRKPEEIIPQLMSSGKVAVKQLINGIRCKPQVLRSSINSKTLLLRTY